MPDHEPVMVAEVLDALQPGRGGLFVDCTVGLGGHAQALLEAGADRLVGLDRVNYFGQVAELDGQGRVLIHPRLRDSAAISGDVDVLGVLTYLDVWNHERFAARITGNPLTDDDLNALSAAGI